MRYLPLRTWSFANRLCSASIPSIHCPVTSV